jgi:hypothetical protein
MVSQLSISSYLAEAPAERILFIIGLKMRSFLVASLRRWYAQQRLSGVPFGSRTGVF